MGGMEKYCVLLSLSFTLLFSFRIILEIDPAAVGSRVLMRGSDGSTPLNELSVSQVKKLFE